MLKARCRHNRAEQDSFTSTYREKLFDLLAGRDPIEVLGQTATTLANIVARHPAEVLRGRAIQVKWTPNGSRALTWGKESGLKLWDLDKGRELKILAPPGANVLQSVLASRRPERTYYFGRLYVAGLGS